MMALNVLVVDDSAVMRSMIIKTLRLAGLTSGEVYQAANGAEGLAVLREQWVDLRIVDINMPVMDGEEMISRIHDEPDLKPLPIIVVSTEGSETRINRLIQSGVCFVHKPFSPEALRDVLQELLGDCAELSA